jgi:hypothetical protein
MHRFLLRRISVKYGRIFALNSALQESRLATLSIQIFLRQSTRLFLESSVQVDSCPAARWQEAKSAGYPLGEHRYVSDERRSQRAAGREATGQNFRETV